MKNVTSPKRQRWFLLIKCLVVLALPVYHLSYHYILPYWKVRPVLRMLSSSDMNDIQAVARAIRQLENAPDILRSFPFNGREAYLIEQKILSILPHLEDEDALYAITFLIDSPTSISGPGRLDFGKYGEDEWDIIKDAVDRLMKLWPKNYEIVFEIHNIHGVNTLQHLYR